LGEEMVDPVEVAVEARLEKVSNHDFEGEEVNREINEEKRMMDEER